MRQGDGADLLGLYDPRSANIGVIYVDPSDDRQSVLTAILTQDKLGRKQVVVVLPEQNKAFQRPVDFDGLKNMRRGLNTEIVFVAPSSPAEFARQRRFPTYSSLESFAQSLKAEALLNGTSKKGIFGFIRKPKQTDANAIPSVSNSYVEVEPALSLPDNAPVAAPQQTSLPSTSDPGEDRDVTDEPTVANAAAMDMAGLAASVGLGSLASDRSASSTFESSGADLYVQSPPVTGSQVDENASSSSTPVQADGHPKPASPNEQQIKAGPGIITLPPVAPRPRITRKFPVSPSDSVPASAIAVESAMQSSGSNAATSSGQGDSGNMAAVGAGAARATRTAAGGGSGLPPGGSSPGGPGGGGGGVGGSRRRTRLLLAILLVVLTLLLIAGIAVATNLPGPAITATVTITPDSKSGALTTDTFVITALTSVTKPDPAKREVGARILTSTSQTQMKTVNATGSIPGARATGSLTFINTSSSTKTFSSVVLTGTSGVPVSFNGPITVNVLPPTVTVTGFAVNVGAAGNIGALDINKSCCASGIIVRNGVFSGGRNAVPNTVILQSDINGAADAIVAALTPGVQADLKNKKRSNEEVAPNTLQCKKSTFNANHKAGDIAKTVTVTVAITCSEEVYDQQGALMMAADLLKAEKDRQFTGYALTGKIVTGVTMISVNKTIVTLVVRAEGVWVYQFSDAVKHDFKTHIANMSKDNALKYLMSQQGVAGVQIDISSGNTLPDASHITINIKSIPGATGTPTVTPGRPRPTGSPSPAATPTITPTPGLGGS
jgi:hypothetical protein